MSEREQYDRDFCTAIGGLNESEWFSTSPRPLWEPDRRNTLLEDLWQYPDDEVTVTCVSDAPTLTLAERFKYHADKWEQETSHLSSPTRMIAHPSYQEIVAMGDEVVPLLIRDMQETGRTWFWALTSLTKANPVDPRDAGKVKRMIDAWVKWGKKRGRL